MPLSSVRPLLRKELVAALDELIRQRQTETNRFDNTVVLIDAGGPCVRALQQADLLRDEPLTNGKCEATAALVAAALTDHTAGTLLCFDTALNAAAAASRQLGPPPAAAAAAAAGHEPAGRSQGRRVAVLLIDGEDRLLTNRAPSKVVAARQLLAARAVRVTQVDQRAYIQKLATVMPARVRTRVIAMLAGLNFPGWEIRLRLNRSDADSLAREKEFLREFEVRLVC